MGEPVLIDGEFRPKLGSDPIPSFQRFRGGGPGRAGGRGYAEEYGGQEEGFDGGEEMSRGWDSGGRGRPQRGGGHPRGGEAAGPKIRGALMGISILSHSRKSYRSIAQCPTAP